MMVKIEGKDQLLRKFRAMPRAVQDEVRRQVSASAGDVRDMQRRLAPKDKGVLAASIRVEVDEFRAKVIAGGTPQTRREVRKGSGEFTDEAILAEFGTKPHRNKGKFAGTMHPGTPPRPFFWPAYRSMKKRIKGQLSRAITKGIKKAAR